MVDLKKEQEKLTKKTVLAATELGINIVQEIAAQSLKQKPGLSLKEFTRILDQYVQKVKTDGLTIK